MIGGFRSPHIKLSGKLFHGGTSVLVLSSCVVFLSRGYPHFKISDAIIPVDASIVNVILGWLISWACSEAGVDVSYNRIDQNSSGPLWKQIIEIMIIEILQLLTITVIK